MSKKKKNKGYANKAASDPRLAGDLPTAGSAEFVPSIEQDLLDAAAYDTADTFDIIPDLHANKFQ